MRYVTYGDLSGLPTRVAKSEDGLMKEAMELSAKRVFLSHSHFDKDKLPQVLALFDSCGAPAYVDADDDELPKTTTARTAERLAESIQTCPRFVLAATENIRKSRWTPWELGFAHGAKGLARVALLPAVPTSWSVPALEQEYLSLYPVVCIETLAGDDGPSWCVRDPRNERFWRLKEWLFF